MGQTVTFLVQERVKEWLCYWGKCVASRNLLSLVRVCLNYDEILYVAITKKSNNRSLFFAMLHVYHGWGKEGLYSLQLSGT